MRHPVRTAAGFTALVAVAAFLGACSGPTAPAEPTWADVYPILQGQCLHCHGSAADQMVDGSLLGGSVRFDFRNATADCAGLTDHDSSFFDAVERRYGSPINYRLTTPQRVGALREGGGSPGDMPPPPASPLEGWQRETIKNFGRGARGPAPAGNRAPELRARVRTLSNSRVEVAYEASDPNGDPILGVLKLGDNLSHRIFSAGAGRVVFDVSGEPSGRGLPISAALCDGWGDGGAVVTRAQDPDGNDLPSVTID